jgi:hypothetical protein
MLAKGQRARRILRKRNDHLLFECAYASEGRYKIQQEAKKRDLECSSFLSKPWYSNSPVTQAL